MKTGIKNGCILILGSPNDKEGNLSLIAKTRLMQGAKELSLHPDFKILLTGGFGKHFNDTNLPHWKYAKDFLINELSVSPGSFLGESIESANSVEDIEKARPIFQKYNFDKIILVTSEFHRQRVEYIIEKAAGSKENILSYSCAADNKLDKNTLKELCDHEEKAIAYLQANYRGNSSRV